MKSLAWLMILQTPQICLTGSIFEYVVRDGLREWAKPPTESAVYFLMCSAWQAITFSKRSNHQPLDRSNGIHFGIMPRFVSCPEWWEQ